MIKEQILLISPKTTKSTSSIDEWDAYLKKAKIDFERRMKRKFRNNADYKLEDFVRRCTLGSGSFATCVAVTNVISGRSYAMKILQKKKIVEMKQLKNTYNEKRLLQSVDCPFTVNMRFFFSDRRHLYFVIPLGQCGEMYNYLRESRLFEEDLSRFYASQVVLALEYLHFLDLAFRDLKPENIVIFSNGYLKLIDFGFCKVVPGRTYTFCGTPEYMAPEVIRNRGYGKAVDWWSMGVLIYEMMAGFSPFQTESTKQTYDLILTAKIRFPRAFSGTVRHLIQHLVQPDLSRRYGNLHNGVQDIKKHDWFLTVDWIATFRMKAPPPKVPPLCDLQGGGERCAPETTPGSRRYSSLFKDF